MMFWKMPYLNSFYNITDNPFKMGQLYSLNNCPTFSIYVLYFIKLFLLHLPVRYHTNEII